MNAEPQRAQGVFANVNGIRTLVGWVARKTPGKPGPRWRAMSPAGNLGWFTDRASAEQWLVEQHPVL
jgi:hypothetical protein